MKPERSDDRGFDLPVRRSVKKMEIEDGEKKPGWREKIRILFRKKKKHRPRTG